MTSTIRINSNHSAIWSLGKRIARDLSTLDSFSRLYYQLEDQQQLRSLSLSASQQDTGQQESQGLLSEEELQSEGITSLELPLVEQLPCTSTHPIDVQTNAPLLSSVVFVSTHESVTTIESVEVFKATGPMDEAEIPAAQTPLTPIADIADSNSTLVEILQESRPVAQQPDSVALDVETPTGLDLSTIHMIRVNREVKWDGFLYQPKHTVMVFFVDGTMYKGLSGVLSSFDPESARLLHPEGWYQWQSDAEDGIQIRPLGADDNEPMVTLDINYHTVTSAQSLNLDSALIYKSMEVSGSPMFGYVRTKRFKVGLDEDGQYLLSTGVLATAAGIDSGLSVSASLQDSEQSLSSGSANFDGGMVLVNSFAQTRRESGLSGRYELSDYELTLYGDDGSVDRLLFLQTSYGAMIGNRYMQLVKEPELDSSSSPA